MKDKICVEILPKSIQLFADLLGDSVSVSLTDQRMGQASSLKKRLQSTHLHSSKNGSLSSLAINIPGIELLLGRQSAKDQLRVILGPIGASLKSDSHSLKLEYHHQDITAVLSEYAINHLPSHLCRN